MVDHRSNSCALARGLPLPDRLGPGLLASTNGQPLPAVPHPTLPGIVLAAAGYPCPWPWLEMESLAGVAGVFTGLEGLVFTRSITS